MMAPYLDPKRFHWVFFGDSFFYPFDNRQQTASTPDMGVYVPLQEKMLARWKKQEGVDGLPADLAGYEEFVRRTMADNQKHVGVAIKFEAAYFRTLYFTDPPRSQAEAIYSHYHGGGVPNADEYRIFQDYIFRVMADQAGKLHLPMHFHTAVGIGDYFSLRQGNVLNLENVVRDVRYKNVTFVLIHGGWPYEREAALLTAVKNVYLDTSFQSEMLYPSQFKDVLKMLLTIYPDKMMYGSDAFPFNEALGAEESMWLAARTSRTALAAALAELVQEGAITEPKALEMARNYLHDTAARMYGDMK
jgi:predicted TIM-barrel fold metal-dependent hydrolase